METPIRSRGANPNKCVPIDGGSGGGGRAATHPRSPGALFQPAGRGRNDSNAHRLQPRSDIVLPLLAAEPRCGLIDCARERAQPAGGGVGTIEQRRRDSAGRHDGVLGWWSRI